MRSRPRPTEAPLQPWSFPDRPWSQLHIDYAGPFMGKMRLVVIDAHSKWIDTHLTSGSTSAITISKLRQSFSTHGILDVIVSDNATGFVSEEFQDFCRHNGIKHITSAQHRSASNGLAERAVGIVKEGVKCMHGGDLETKLARFLFDYRITPQSTTGIAPAELLMHRQLKSRLHLIRPDVYVKVVAEQTKQKTKHDRHAKVRTFQPGELGYALRYHGNTAGWVPGTIHLQTGPVSYTVRLEDGTIARHHTDQLQGRLSSHQVWWKVWGRSTGAASLTSEAARSKSTNWHCACCSICRTFGFVILLVLYLQCFCLFITVIKNYYYFYRTICYVSIERVFSH